MIYYYQSSKEVLHKKVVIQNKGNNSNISGITTNNSGNQNQLRFDVKNDTGFGDSDQDTFTFVKERFENKIDESKGKDRLGIFPKLKI